MPRVSRTNLSTFSYFHICVRGNNGQTIFEDVNDYLKYLSLIEKYRFKCKMDCYAYCLMPNHAHILFRTSNIKALSKAMHGLNLSYVMCFNRKYKLKGHLFQSRFSSWLILNEKHLLKAKQYIEQNPVKAGLVTNKKLYEWGSGKGDSSIVTLSKIKI